MNTKSNLHTHCNYCDGKNTPRELIEKAVDLGFRSLGFSSHSYTGLNFDECGLTQESSNKYFVELNKLKKEYENIIDIFIGLEVEGLKPIITGKTDFLIGSLHYFETNKEIIPIDYTPEILKKGIKQLDSNPLNMVRNYLEKMITFAKNVNFDIVGHLDLFTKFNEIEQIVDENNFEYRKIMIDAVDELNRLGKIFEINTGAIGRGYRTKPYPSAFILNHILKINAPITISSDAHNAEMLSCNFSETEIMLKEIGFKKQLELTKDGFIEVDL